VPLRTAMFRVASYVMPIPSTLLRLAYTVIFLMRPLLVPWSNAAPPVPPNSRVVWHFFF
jgi:hypothetical protein